MLKRAEYLRKINDLLEDERYGDIDEVVGDMLSEIEDEIQNSLTELNNINSIENLDNIVNARDIIDEIANKLY